LLFVCFFEEVDAIEIENLLPSQPLLPQNLIFPNPTSTKNKF